MPGVRGPAQTPTTPVEAIAPLIASVSNQSSSRSPTGIVMHAEQLVQLAAAEPGCAARLAQQAEQVAGPLRAERGRRAEEQRAQEVRCALEQLLEAGYAAASFLE